MHSKGNTLIKPTLILVAFTLFFTAGCHRNPNSTGGTLGTQPLTSPENATAAYQSALGQTCGQKHLEQLSPDDLRTQVQGFYQTLGSSARDLYDRSMRKTCGDDTSASCYNTAIFRGAVQDGKMQSLVDHVCQSR
jgi:hypothetical protein